MERNTFGKYQISETYYQKSGIEITENYSK